MSQASGSLARQPSVRELIEYTRNLDEKTYTLIARVEQAESLAEAAQAESLLHGISLQFQGLSIDGETILNFIY